jgi:AcrR family transcriptional regulator
MSRTERGAGMTDRGRATRARLIEATLAVVRDVGYPHASTRAIAQAAGVAEGTIYRHFPDKASLFFAAVLESNAPIVEWVATLPARAGESTVEDNLIQTAVRLAGLQDQIIPLELAIAVDPELTAQRRRALAAAGSLPPGPPEEITAYIAEEQRLGRVRADLDPREAAVLILAALFGLAAGQAIDDAGIDDAHVVSAVRLIVRGLRPMAPQS